MKEIISKNFKSYIESAFTLAETLIVIGIIGVVAALTLPNLNHATGDKETVTRVKKIYSALTDAVDRAQVIYGPLDEWFKDLDKEDYAKISERYAKRVTEFMKVSKDCGHDEGCFNYKRTGDDVYALKSWWGDCKIDTNDYEYNYMVTLSDGISVAFEGWSGHYIRVDIDGPNKGKNQMGSDRFDFGFRNGQIVPSTVTTLDNPGNWSSCSENTTAWVIQNGNLDYLKCPDELNWETQTSCK